MDWLQPFLVTSQDPLENTALDIHAQTTEPLWNSRFPVDKFQHIVGEKIYKLGCTEESKKNSMTLPAPPLFRDNTRGQERSQSVIFPSQERKSMSVSVQIAQLCETLAKRQRTE